MDTKINTIWQKLLQIQKKYATFAITEPSDKTNKNGDAEYKYTPNWQIIEPIRKELDAMGIMLITDIEDVTTQIVEYPIYRINPKNEIVSFLKKDTLSTVKMTYYFIDTNTGECTPVMRMIATDANGIDKSTSSAISLAERYIFLKFFHITTRERSESNDSHDCQQNLPGIGRINQNGNPEQLRTQTTRQNPRQPYEPQPQSPQMHTVNNQPQQNDLYSECVNNLAFFQADTPSFNTQMNICLTKLAQAGYQTADPNFQNALKNESQRIRNQLCRQRANS